MQIEIYIIMLLGNSAKEFLFKGGKVECSLVLRNIEGHDYMWATVHFKDHFSHGCNKLPVGGNYETIFRNALFELSESALEFGEKETAKLLIDEISKIH